MFSSRSADLARMIGKFGCALSLGASLLSTSLQAQAQAPNGNPIRLLVGFPAGAGTDAIARALGEKLKDELGVPVVVENRAGAGGQIAAQALKAAAADGHTLLLSHGHTISILPLVVKNPGFPYRGSAPMMADMLGNQIGAGIASVPDFIENHRAGKVRIVATIGAKRQALLPQVPTFTELGFADLDDLPYYGVFAPVGTPQPFIDRFGVALAKVLAMPDFRQKLTTMGLTVGYEPQGQFAGRVRTYTQGWERIIQARGFKAQ